MPFFLRVTRIHASSFLSDSNSAVIIKPSSVEFIVTAFVR